MSRLSVFNSPFLLGFDHIEKMLNTAAKSGNDGYPPYNIEHVDDNNLRITLAVAGFAPDDLDIRLEDNQLVITGRQTDETDRVYLHRGIAARQFQRKFVLAEGLEVDDAIMDNGLLHIELKRPQPERVIKSIPINKGNENKHRLKSEISNEGSDQ